MKTDIPGNLPAGTYIVAIHCHHGYKKFLVRLPVIIPEEVPARAYQVLFQRRDFLTLRLSLIKSGECSYIPGKSYCFGTPGEKDIVGIGVYQAVIP